MRSLVLVVVLSLLPLTAIPVGAEPWYGGTFEGTGWVLLRIDAFEPTRVSWDAPDNEGYSVLLRTVYYDDGREAWSGGSLHIDPGPGFYVDPGGGSEGVVIAPNPSVLSSVVCLMCGGTGISLGDDSHPPGVYYAVVGVGGEVSGWTLDAPRSTLLASGPTHFKWRSDLEGAPFVEVNAATASVATAAGPRSLEFDIEHTLHGVFGDYYGYQHGNATLTLPDGSLKECFCYGPRDDGGPGTYRYEDDRTSVFHHRMPVAVWMDVPLPWT